MQKICVLFRKKRYDWQREKVATNVYMNYPVGAASEDVLEAEIQSRIIQGEEKGIEKNELIDEYIKHYYPEHTRTGVIFGTMVKIDEKKKSAKDLKAKVNTIIDNCLDKKNAYFRLEKVRPFKRSEQEDEIIYLTSKGRSLADPIGIPITKGIRINVGLINALYLELGAVRRIIVWLISILIAANWRQLWSYLRNL